MPDEAARDKKSWARFENAEPSISAAIARASTGAECDAVEAGIKQLAKELRP